MMTSSNLSTAAANLRRTLMSATHMGDRRPSENGDKHGDAALEALQVRCRKDPESYVEDYQREALRLRGLLRAAELAPSQPSGALEQAAQFVSAVAGLYPNQAKDPANQMMEALTSNGVAMHHQTRRALVRAVAVMRARGVLQPMPVLKLFLELLQCKDKSLRRDLIGQVLSDLRRPVDEPTKKKLQAAVFATFHVSEASAADDAHTKRILLVVIDLFRKRVWHDSRTANVIAENVFHPSPAIMVLACKFLVGEHDADESDGEDEEDDEDSAPNTPSKGNGGGDGSASMRARELWVAYHKTSRKTTRKRKRLERQVSRLNRHGRTRARTGSSRLGNSSLDSSPFAALMMINDPQDFAERLFSDLQKSRKNESFEARLAIVNLTTRLVGAHELQLLNLYPFLQRYMRPHQTQVTVILAYLVQACHPLIPPDALYPVVRTLADYFVSDRCSGEAVAAGINAIRAICSRVPSAIHNPEVEGEKDDAASALLQDLVEFKGSRDKGISTAARSLLQLYREVNPALLKKRDRGKEGAEKARGNVVNNALRYGYVNVADGVAGVEFLNCSSDDGDPGSDDYNSASGSDIVEGPNSDSDSDGSDLGEISIQSESDIEDEEEKVVQALDPANPQPTEDKLRILTDADFRRIRKKQAASDLAHVLGPRKVDTGGAFDPAEIESYQVRRKRTLEERLETVRAGREGRENFGSKKGRKEKTGGKSNKEKRKTKANSMILHKMKRKRINESMKQKQARLVTQRKGKRHKK